MTSLRPIASYVTMAAVAVMSCVSTAASAQLDLSQYQNCTSGCSEAYGPNSPYRDNMKASQCFANCELRYLGGTSGDTPYVPPYKPPNQPDPIKYQ